MTDIQRIIRGAITHPEMYAPRMYNIETVPEWQARAVIYALRSVGVLARPRAIQRHLSTAVNRCAVCSPRSWIATRKRMCENLVDVHYHP